MSGITFPFRSNVTGELLTEASIHANIQGVLDDYVADYQQMRAGQGSIWRKKALSEPSFVTTMQRELAKTAKISIATAKYDKVAELLGKLIFIESILQTREIYLRQALATDDPIYVRTMAATLEIKILMTAAERRMRSLSF